MAALVEGQQYGLSAQDKINCTKSLIFVKLTDSALRSIEECFKNKDTARPTIQFQNSTGMISLLQNGSRLSYGFTLSNIEADGPHGSFECIRQTGHRSMESLGCMQVKMHIHATEDSYENTKVKMAAVEEQQKKSCTKVIKPAGAHLGRKVKVKRPGLVVSPVKFSPPTASMINKSVPLKPVSNIPPPAPPPSSFPVKRPEPPKPKPPPPPAPHKNPELIRQPIRDRIIHILAVRPYKRPELLMRLKHEGVREKDKNKLTSILPQISVLKGNIYYLANYLWNEVQDNWKFCTQEEAEIIRKRKQQYLNSNSESETSPSNTQTSTSPLQKRFVSEAVTEHPPSKKQRISHYKADQQQPRSSYGGSTSESSPGNFPKKSFSPGPVQSSIPNGVIHNEDSNHKSPVSNGSDSYPTTPPKSLSNNVLSTSSPTNQRTREDSEKSSSRSHPPMAGLLRKPTFQKTHPVSRNSRHDVEEPSQHRASSNPHLPKNYVNSDMGKSQTLSHPQSVDSVSSSKVSPDLNNQYRVEQAKEDSCSKTTTNGYKIKGKIYKEYRAYQQDPNYIEALKKFNFLHRKLAYIKRLVTEYDNAQCAKS
ncbi:RNA polymerase II elongation factor ELL2 like protein [Argiope bruennichi]|uniref:RNA polymerase II elongation factor ELL2 like protein n=1 Tax=Argiope bruennichi TaxID=94029 RepID=A0A8T0FDD7_ARGBR|nr:RNA polymerase II elongation factor ELL2 like protein [Argiope bruennichi]